MLEIIQVWVFNGIGEQGLPSAVFLNFEPAKEWIKENRVSGTPTAYPVI